MTTPPYNELTKRGGRVVGSFQSRRQTASVLRVAAAPFGKGSLNLSATSPMTTSNAETDVKLNIYRLYIYNSVQQSLWHIMTLSKLVKGYTEHFNTDPVTFGPGGPQKFWKPYTVD